MKTLYVDIDADISDLLKKFKDLKDKQILLVIPKNSLVFGNSINLKTLKKLADDEGKELQVFTNDEKGKLMLEKAGIKVYKGQLKKRSTLRSAELNKLTVNVPKKQSEKKVSITDVSQKTIKQTAKLIMSAPQKKREKKDQKDWARFFVLSTLKKKTVIAFASLALVFFVIVLYIAIPSATIYLTPASNVLEATVNITIADRQKNSSLFLNPGGHVLAMYPIEMEFEKSLLYKPTGKVFTGSNARCNLKIINKRSSPWTLIPKTRLADSTGVVFRINEDLEVPGSHFELLKDEQGNVTREKVPGSVIVSVEADKFDENENVIGARGNLPANTHFNLPGLSVFNQSLLFAVNEQACRGGVTEFYSIINEDDITAARNKIEDLMKDTARQYLQDFVDGENVKRAEQNSDKLVVSSPLVLFDHSSAIFYEVLDTSVPAFVKPGEKADEFSVVGSMLVKGIAYEKQGYNELLEQSLLARVHPDKVLSNIDFDSVTYNIVWSDSDLTNFTKVKISVAVRGVEEYNFDPHSEKGQELINRVLDYVPGKLKNDASYFINNLEEIQKSHVVIWPFWKNNLPDRKASIKIKVQ